MTTNNETQGLYDKYKVEKTDGTPVDPDAQYFVLRVDTDRHARFAVLSYANSIRNDNPQLSYDLAKWVWQFERTRLLKIAWDSIREIPSRSFSAIGEKVITQLKAIRDRGNSWQILILEEISSSEQGERS